jgi:hypothetical protein
MADTDQRMTELQELMERAEGYLNDAEFREDFEMRQVRYLQAMTSLLLTIAKQNELVIELLKRAQM